MSTSISESEHEHGDEHGHGLRAAVEHLDVHEHDPATIGEEVVEGHGHPSDLFYVGVALILGVITAMEVSLTYLDVGRIFLPALLVLMAIKFFMVVLFFMHLRFDNKVFGRLFYSGLLLAVTVYVAALATFHVFR